MKLSIKIFAIMTILTAVLTMVGACDDGGGEDDATGTENEPSTEEPDEVSVDESGIVTVSRAYEYSDEDIMNPERGFYGWIGTSDALNAGKDHLKYRQNGQTLAFADIQFDKINANAFRDKPLSDTFLQDLSAFFGRVRKAGIKLVLRFCYGDEAPDAPLARILEHIGQLKPVLQENADVIAVLQAGFIGYWGEWHHSGGADTYGLDDTTARAEVIDALLNALPGGVSIQVRRPSFKTDHLGTMEPLTADIAHNGGAAARIGHHNDCFLASDTDMGTYPTSQIEFWKDYIEDDGAFVPVGGETCEVNPPRSECQAALTEMERLNWSFINAGYNDEVISSWEAGGCLPEMRKEIGYRFVLEGASWNEPVPPSGALAFKAAVKNAGYSAPFNERPVYAVLTGPACYKAKLAADPRFWGGGSTNKIEANIELPVEIADGSYNLSLWLPDPSAALQGDPRYSVQFANVGTWDEAGGLNVLTDSLVVDKSAPRPSLMPDVSFEACQ